MHPDLQSVFTDKPSILKLFHETFGTEAVRRVQSLLGKIAKEKESWQEEGFSTGDEPADQPALVTHAFAAWKRFGTLNLQRHFAHSLEMAAVSEFYTDWETLKDLLKRGEKDVEIGEEHRTIYKWIMRDMDKRPNVRGERTASRLTTWFLERIHERARGDVNSKAEDAWKKNLDVAHALHSLSRVFGKGVFVLMPTQYRGQ